MILSEKITELRKRSGLSQEEFGAEIGVSRQAVSKWEMAQTTPDMNKIVAMSEFFGVPTDFLLKDEYDLSDLGGGAFAKASEADGEAHDEGQESGFDGTQNGQERFLDGTQKSQSASGLRMIELPEIQEYFKTRKIAARNFVIANVIFWTSPFVGIYLSYRQESLATAGVVVELLMLCVMAVLLVVTIMMLRSRERSFRKDAELAYGVRGVALEEQRKFDRTLLIGIVLGVISLLTFVVPVVIVSGVATAHELAIILAAYAMLLIFAFGISCIVYVMTISHGFKKVLKVR